MSAASDLVKDKQGELEQALNVDKTWLAHKMNSPSVGLLSNEEHEDVINPRSMLRETEKAGIIVTALLRRAQLDPNVLQVFLGILYQKRKQYEPAIKLLEGRPEVASSSYHPQATMPQDTAGGHRTPVGNASRPAHVSPTPGVSPPYPSPPHPHGHSGSNGRSSHAAQDDGLCIDTVDNSDLGEDDVADLLEALEPLASRWQILATKLRLRQDAISLIASNHHGDNLLALTKAIGEWHKKNYNFKKFGSPSWRLLVQIVQKMDYSLAEKIANEHRVQQAAVPSPLEPHTPPSSAPPLSNSILNKEFSLRRLGNVTYTGKMGKGCELFLLEEMSVKWEQVGDVIGLRPNQLANIRSECHSNEDCMRRVATEWMQRGPDEFPATWGGVLALLKELGMRKLVKELQEAIRDTHSTLHST